MAAALLPGPSSPLLFFGKRELWRLKQRREGLTQRRPHTTAAGEPDEKEGRRGERDEGLEKVTEGERN
ncbi:unconventional myosin-Ic isoform X1 [Lates japonicus]|uniref:Unconventional myosin-Ic isoform X1 n=1 Tax=Lates japonicus TaxID=270547 RepID=A0AAD3QWH2_LATJO|nr:unconventional myosin-Ic isoform X1 [Lates japonicus]